MPDDIYLSTVGNNIRKSLLKRQEALNRCKARKESFLHAKEQITKDIEEARNTWNHTLEQLPNLPFGEKPKVESRKPKTESRK